MNLNTKLTSGSRTHYTNTSSCSDIESKKLSLSFPVFYNRQQYKMVKHNDINEAVKPPYLFDDTFFTSKSL